MGREVGRERRQKEEGRVSAELRQEEVEELERTSCRASAVSLLELLEKQQDAGRRRGTVGHFSLGVFKLRAESSSGDARVRKKTQNNSREKKEGKRDTNRE